MEERQAMVVLVLALTVLTVVAWAAPAAALAAPTRSLYSSGSRRIPACRSRTLQAQAGTPAGSTRQTHRSTQDTRQSCCRNRSSSPHPPSESQAAVLVEAWVVAMESHTSHSSLGRHPWCKPWAKGRQEVPSCHSQPRWSLSTGCSHRGW